MGLMSWLEGLFQADDENGYEIEKDISKDADTNKETEPPARRKPMIALFEPRDYRDGMLAADKILHGDDVVINLRRLDETGRQRITDFLCGVTYRTDCDVTFTSSDVLLCKWGKRLFRP